RMTLTDANNNGIFDNYSVEVLQADDYYPFGMRITRKLTSSENNYTYNGKEHENDFGLNWYHYGARYYDPAVGRWWVVDPAREFQSSYLFSANSPIVWSDPDGKETMNNVQYNYAMGNLVRIFQTLHISDMYNQGYQATSQTDGGIYLKTNFDMRQVSASPLYQQSSFLDNLIGGVMSIAKNSNQSPNDIKSDVTINPVKIYLYKQNTLDFTITGFDYKYEKSNPKQTEVIVTILISRSDGSSGKLGTMTMSKGYFEKVFDIENLKKAGEQAREQGMEDGRKGQPNEKSLYQSLTNFFSDLKSLFGVGKEKM
ncbi:MAG: RHS repeat-associated core domain-containing protein, partial [Bacteroidetes bacterium]|nr:RHS repeat-associated core domain-containing protein [Bacteroidota bacterium]